VIIPAEPQVDERGRIKHIGPKILACRIEKMAMKAKTTSRMTTMASRVTRTERDQIALMNKIAW
jgi:hypothetical protein